jgi:serine protease DegS
MRIQRLIYFILQAIVVGLATAFLIILFNPDFIQPDHREDSSMFGLQRFSGPVSYATAVESAAPAVVNIHTEKVVTRSTNPFSENSFFRDFFGDSVQIPQKQVESSLGSGVIISEDGYILTNNHVIEGATEILIGMKDGRVAEASIVGTDPDTDLAVLKVDLKELPVIKMGNSDNIRVGDVVLAIGNPFGVGQTVTMGIISATGRTHLGLSTFENFIQTDAAINPGNSGGALVNAHGELLGINAAIFSQSGGSHGIGFAIPVNMVRDVLDQIIENGHVSRGWMGITIVPLQEVPSSSLNYPVEFGVIIMDLHPNGPAQRAGLLVNDIITHINDEPVLQADKLLKIITSTPPGEEIEVQVLRGGVEKRFKIKVGERPIQ